MPFFERPLYRGRFGRLVDHPYFAYRGGKARLRRYIVRWCLPSGSTYCEPFAGRANIFFMVRGFADYKKWHLNDLQTIPFFKSILNYDGKPLPILNKQESIDLYKSGDPLHHLLEPITWRSGGLASRKASPHGTRLDVVEYRKRIIFAKKLLQGVELTNLDALEVIHRYRKDSKAFLYIDPPYINSNVGSYDEGMLDRPALIKLLKQCQCRWLLSEQPCDDFLSAFGNPLTSIKNIPVNPRPGTKVKWTTEVLWSNYKTKPLLIDFGDREKSAMAESHRLLKKHRRISIDDWPKMVPPQWSKQTISIQMDRLSRQPENYFDGQEIWIVE